MSDVFSLAPEGQAWTDDKAAANPARPEDYEPTFFQGSIAAPVRGVAEGTLGLAQSAVGFSKRLISDPAFTADVAPTVNIFRVMFPDADKALNETYDTIGKQLQDARGYVKPDAGSQGTAARFFMASVSSCRPLVRPLSAALRSVLLRHSAQRMNSPIRISKGRV